MVWVIIGSIWILPSMYQSTIFGTSVRPRAPPKAVPIQVRPVTSWNGRVEISWPAPATPMITDLPQPRCDDFQRLAHHLGVAGAVEGIVGAADRVAVALGHVDEIGHDVVADLLRIDEMRHAEFFAPGLAVVVDIDADDHVGTGKPQALDAR